MDPEDVVLRLTRDQAKSLKAAVEIAVEADWEDPGSIGVPFDEVGDNLDQILEKIKSAGI